MNDRVNDSSHNGNGDHNTGPDRLHHVLVQPHENVTENLQSSLHWRHERGIPPVHKRTDNGLDEPKDRLHNGLVQPREMIAVLIQRVLVPLQEIVLEPVHETGDGLRQPIPNRLNQVLVNPPENFAESLDSRIPGGAEGRVPPLKNAAKRYL